jgi:hypothetical protein
VSELVWVSSHLLGAYELPFPKLYVQTFHFLKIYKGVHTLFSIQHAYICVLHYTQPMYICEQVVQNMHLCCFG